MEQIAEQITDLIQRQWNLEETITQDIIIAIRNRHFDKANQLVKHWADFLVDVKGKDSYDLNMIAEVNRLFHELEKFETTDRQQRRQNLLDWQDQYKHKVDMQILTNRGK